MFKPSPSQNKASDYERFSNSRKESKTNTNGMSKTPGFQSKFNWQKNVITRTSASNNAFHKFPYHQSFFPYGNQNLFHNTSKFYRLITTESNLWQSLRPRLDAIIKAPTTRPFQYMLDFIQKQAHTHNSGINDISLLNDYLRSLPEKDRHFLQVQVFPEMAKLVLKTPVLFPEPKDLAMLNQGHRDTISLTREQCACLLSHMFMCTTLRQSSSTLPMRFDFSQLYSRTRQRESDDVKSQKITCLLNYFRKITTSSFDPKEVVTFSRVHIDKTIHGKCDLAAWTELPDILKEVDIDPTRKIEDTQSTVEVDFANKYLGGGVLGSGSVQEEIQFITRPEQLVGLLFCESMTDEEAILIRGAKIYSGYKGYAGKFAFDSESPFSECGELLGCEREVVAIDAKDFSRLPHHVQFGRDEILRELNKAYVGFVGDYKMPSDLTKKKDIATGGWGCGCFKGDAQLKFLIQWMAASRAGRRMSYHLFGNKDVLGFQKIVETYRGHTIGKLMQDILTSVILMSENRKGLFETLLHIMDYNKPGYL